MKPIRERIEQKRVIGLQSRPYFGLLEVSAKAALQTVLHCMNAAIYTGIKETIGLHIGQLRQADVPMLQCPLSVESAVRSGHSIDKDICISNYVFNDLFSHVTGDMPVLAVNALVKADWLLYPTAYAAALTDRVCLNKDSARVIRYCFR